MFANEPVCLRNLHIERNESGMLEKIVSVKCVGLFENISEPVIFAKNTLIYGENAKGKSTLACLLRSAASNDTSQMSAKKTFNTNDPIAHAPCVV